MTLTYQLDKEDFLAHQLFLASRSERVKKTRRKSWLIVSGSMFLLSWMFFRSNNVFLGYYFIVFGILTAMFYPLYQRWQYKNHYAKFVADRYKNLFGQTENIHFDENTIESDDVTGTFKIR